MIAFEDPQHTGNSSLHWTGHDCIEGCGRPAGTAWSPHWCFECNVKRIRRISASLDSIMSKVAAERLEGEK